MRFYARAIAVVLVCAMAVASTGCHSMKTVRPAQPGAPAFGKVKAGDVVRVRTQDGRTAQFVVQQVDGEALVATDGTRYTRAEISRLERRTFSLWKVATLAAVLFVAFAFLQYSTDDSLLGDGQWK